MDFLQAFTPIALDLIGTIVFVAIYWSTDNIALATVAGVAVAAARFIVTKVRGKAVGPLQYLSVVIVLATGVATLITKNPQFVMLKSSLISLAVGGVMLSTNWMAPYLPAIVTENLDRRTIGWASAGWGILQILLAASNVVVALGFGIKVWAVYAATVPNAALIGGFVVNYLVFRLLVARSIRARHAAQAEQATD